jgi:hypothetical protein
LTRQAVTENLNVLDYESYITVTDLILENKIPELLIFLTTFFLRDLIHHFVSGLASHFRDLLVSKLLQHYLWKLGTSSNVWTAEMQSRFVKRNRYYK